MRINPTLQHRFTGTLKTVTPSPKAVTPPMTCHSCGSTHFIKTQAEEFSNTGYNSAEFRSLTFQPQSVHVCLCGTPMPMHGLSEECNYGDNPKGRYLSSLHRAIAHRKAHQPQVLAQGCVSLTEHQELRDHVADQQEQIERLLEAVAALERAEGGDADEDV
jgi:hypothetical protein